MARNIFNLFQDKKVTNETKNCCMVKPATYILEEGVEETAL